MRVMKKMTTKHQSAGATASSPFEARHLRIALGKFATGVAIVTAAGEEDRYVGLTINSFSSVSLDPPLVLWSLASKSTNLHQFKSATHFAIHVLGDRQRSLAERFATNVAERFDGVEVLQGVGRTPLLKDCCVRFTCRTVSVMEAGDHHIFMGEVVDLYEAGEVQGSLLFYKGQLHSYTHGSEYPSAQ